MRALVKKLLGRGPRHSIIRTVQERGLTFLEEPALNDLYDAVRRIEQSRMPGALVEAGCAEGGSAIVLATAKSASRPLYVYDVFGMIPPPSERDGEDIHRRYEVIKGGQSEGLHGRQYYGYVPNLLDVVVGHFRDHGVPVDAHNVHLVKGLFQDTMHLDEPVALAHVDGDWYESVMTCLERLTPRLVPGGVLVIDDYDAWSGCRTAVDEYFKGRSGYSMVRRSRLHVVRE